MAISLQAWPCKRTSCLSPQIQLCCLAKIKTHCGRDVTGRGGRVLTGTRRTPLPWRTELSEEFHFILHHVTTTCSKWACLPHLQMIVFWWILIHLTSCYLTFIMLHIVATSLQSNAFCLKYNFEYFMCWLDARISLRKRPVSGLQEAGAAIWVDLLHRGLTWWFLCFFLFFFPLYMQHLILQHFCVSCSVDWALPTLQVAERAQVLGSGLLAKGCQPNPQQFVGIFAQNRPEVWKETSKLFSLGTI